MSGDGHAAVMPPRWDQRPGELEATRGLLVVGSRRLPGWTVLVAVRGEDGSFCQVALSTEEARNLAAELNEMADVLEGVIW